MNSGVKDKLYGLEATPPPGLWEKIAAELDDSELAAQFPRKLATAEVSPPAHTWQQIAAALDDTPFLSGYAHKLKTLEVTPPATAWPAIEQSLNHQEGGNARRIPLFFRYAAAAVLIAFMAWGAVRIFKPANNKELASENTVKPSSNQPAPTQPATDHVVGSDETPGKTVSAENDAAIEDARNDAALEASKKTFARLDVTKTRSKVRDVSDFFFVADNYDYVPTGTSRCIDCPPPAQPPAIENMRLTDRYLVLTMPDGNIIRMSKKLENLICCVSGEDEDKDCIDQMKKWREKIASPLRAHAAGNFLDILSMAHALQDN